MAGTGNPYLDAYAQQQHLYGSPVGVQPRKSRRMARLARLKKMQEEQEQATASQAEFAGGFPEPAKELSPVEKRLKQYQDTWRGYLKDAATLNRAPTEEETLAYQKMANPLLVQAELADEDARKKAWDEYWNAVDAGNGEAIDALLPANGEMWDAHRKEREQLEQSREYIKTLDPTTQAPLIEQYKKALESSWEAHKENEKRLEEYSKRLDAGIARRAAAEREIGAGEAPTGYFATIGDKLKEFGPPTLGWMGKQLERPVNVVAAALTGDVALPGVSLFDKDIQAKGAQNRAIATEAVRQASEDVGNMSSVSGVAATLNPVLPTLKYGRKLGVALSELSDQTEGLGYLVPGAAGNVALTKAKDFFSGVTKPEERNEKYGTTTSAFAVDLALDPTAWLPSGMASKAFSRIIKPIEPVLDAMSKRIGVKATAKAVRWAVIGGIPLEDPDMARYAIASKAAEVDKAAPIIREGYQAEAAIKAKWAEIPPEIRPRAQEAAPRLLEGTTREMREFPEHLNTALAGIPTEHRKSVVAYAQAIDDADVMLKNMTAETLGRNVELSDGILEGYLARRFSPETKLLLAEHPEIREALKDLAQAQHLHATGQEIPAANQFAKRKFTEGTTYHEAEKVLQEKFGKLFEGRAVWDRDQASVVLGDYLFAANAAKKQADVEEFTRIFGAVDGAADDAIPAADFFKRFNAKMPEEFAGKFIPKARLKEFEGIRHIADPGKFRQILNRLTGWVSRSVLATPGSVSKDIKGQIINAAITDPNILRHTDDAGRLILSGKVDDDLAELMAAGLERPSFDQIVSPSVIKATEEFGGGALGKAAGVVEESGFTGGAIRGLGKAAQKVPGLKTIGKGVEAVGKGVGYVGRKSLNARQTSESIFRLATYKAAKARGLSRDEALREVAKWWGDFSQLSKLEANVLKGFVMFFSWQLRALKIGAAHFVDHPFRTRLFLALAAGNVSGDPSFPEWAQRQGGTVIGRDEFGNPKFISMGAGSYFEPLGDIFQGEAMQRLRTDGLRGVPRGLAQTALRRLAPLAQAPIEYMTNYDSFSGGQIYLEKGQDTARTRVSDHGPASLLWLPKGLRDMLGVREVVRKDDGEFSYVHVDPEWNWLFNKVAPGVGAELATVNPAADPRKDAWEAAARALGFPTYSVREQDVQKQVANKVRILTDAMRKEIGGTGLAINDAGSVYFDQTSTIGREMAADNERWKREAAEGKYNADAYLRWKMGAKYPEALRFIDLGAYLNGWRKGIESEREALQVPKADNLKAIRRLAGREAEKEQRRRLRGAPR